MKRRNFIRKIGIGALIALIAPKAIKELPIVKEEETETLVIQGLDQNWKTVTEEIDIPISLNRIVRIEIKE